MAKKKLAHRLLGLCVRYAQPLSCVLYFAALSGYLYLPQAAKPNYLDENALLAGFAHSQIRYSPSMSSVQDQMKNGILASKHPLEAAHHAMHEMHLPHWLQQTSHNSMLHAVVPATRTDGKEAIAFVTPVSGNMTAQPGALAAIKVATALLHYLSQAQWLAKDVIWLVVDDDSYVGHDSINAKDSKQHAAKAWLDMHHGAAATLTGTASGYSGVIQQALILDMQSASFNALNIEAIGWNGQMPQLDLYFLVKRLAEIGSGLQFTQAAVPHWVKYVPSQMHQYCDALAALTRFSWQQAMRQPTGIHADFLSLGIDAVTLQAVHDPQQASWAFSAEEGITKLAVMLELVFRSLNNLLERFHHSTVFYILLSPDWHVPFQAYVMCPILLIAVIVLQAADCGKVTRDCNSNLKTRQVQASMTAGHTVLAIQAICLGVCLVVNWGASKAVSLLQVGPNTLPGWTPIFTMLVALLVLLTAFGSTLLSHTNSTPEEVRGLKITTLAVVAAESCVLVCADWACAFLVLVLVVPIWLLQPMVNVKLLVVYTSMLFAWSASLVM